MKRPIITVDGTEAVALVAHKINEVIAIYPITPSSGMGEFADAWSAVGKTNIWGTVPLVVEMQSEEEGETMVPFTRFHGRDTLYWTHDLAYVRDRMDDIYERTRGARDEEEDHINDTNKDSYLIDGKNFTGLLEDYRVIEFGQQVFYEAGLNLLFKTSPQPAFNKNFDLFSPPPNLPHQGGRT